ncbi:hypothetical protein IFM89_034292, partial [Coptis chinensis]
MHEKCHWWGVELRGRSMDCEVSIFLFYGFGSASENKFVEEREWVSGGGLGFLKSWAFLRAGFRLDEDDLLFYIYTFKILGKSETGIAVVNEFLVHLSSDSNKGLRIKINDSVEQTMVRGRDACWEHCVLVDATKQKVRCNYCQREFSGGVYRMKFHLAQIKNKDIVPCTEVPNEVRDWIQSILTTPKKQKNPKRPKLDLVPNGPQHSSSTSDGFRPNPGSSGQNEAMVKMVTEDKDKIEFTKEHPMYINAHGALGSEFAILGRTLNSP